MEARSPMAPDPSYPQRVSLEGTHHSEKQGLLQEGEESADQGLQACEAAKLRGGVPARAVENLSPQVPLSAFPGLRWLAPVAGAREEAGAAPEHGAGPALDDLLLSGSAK